jgi:hypothetical protein
MNAALLKNRDSFTSLPSKCLEDPDDPECRKLRRLLVLPGIQGKFFEERVQLPDFENICDTDTSWSFDCSDGKTYTCHMESSVCRAQNDWSNPIAIEDGETCDSIINSIRADPWLSDDANDYSSLCGAGGAVTSVRDELNTARLIFFLFSRLY